MLAEFPKYASLSNDQLRAKTQEFKTRIADFSKKEREEIAALNKRIETELEIDVEEKEKLYEEIDGLESFRRTQRAVREPPDPYK